MANDKLGEKTKVAVGSEQDNSSPPLEPDALVVVSRKDGFRRAGRAWKTTPTTIPLDELTEDQIKQLLAEPMLKVDFIVSSVQENQG